MHKKAREEHQKNKVCVLEGVERERDRMGWRGTRVEAGSPAAGRETGVLDQRSGRREPSAGWGRPCRPGAPGAFLPPPLPPWKKTSSHLPLSSLGLALLLPKDTQTPYSFVRQPMESLLESSSLSTGHTALPPEPPSARIYSLYPVTDPQRPEDQRPLSPASSPCQTARSPHSIQFSVPSLCFSNSFSS